MFSLGFLYLRSSRMSRGLLDMLQHRQAISMVNRDAANSMHAALATSPPRPRRLAHSPLLILLSDRQEVRCGVKHQ
jgi:hypothetical protein